jgi:hypothetical protein
MIVIDEEGNVAIRDGDPPALFEDRYQGHICADQGTLEAMLGCSPGLVGWVITVITSKRRAMRAVIQRADQAAGPDGCAGLPAWEVHGPDGTLGPVVKALLKAKTAAGAPSPAVPLALTSPSNGANHV